MVFISNVVELGDSTQTQAGPGFLNRAEAPSDKSSCQMFTDLELKVIFIRWTVTRYLQSDI